MGVTVGFGVGVGRGVGCREGLGLCTVVGAEVGTGVGTRLGAELAADAKAIAQKYQQSAKALLPTWDMDLAPALRAKTRIFNQIAPRWPSCLCAVALYPLFLLYAKLQT